MELLPNRYMDVGITDAARNKFDRPSLPLKNHDLKWAWPNKISFYRILQRQPNVQIIKYGSLWFVIAQPKG
jgi:hypothetical protein